MDWQTKPQEKPTVSADCKSWGRLSLKVTPLARQASFGEESHSSLYLRMLQPGIILRGNLRFGIYLHRGSEGTEQPEEGLERP